MCEGWHGADRHSPITTSGWLLDIMRHSRSHGSRQTMCSWRWRNEIHPRSSRSASRPCPQPAPEPDGGVIARAALHLGHFSAPIQRAHRGSLPGHGGEVGASVHSGAGWCRFWCWCPCWCRCGCHHVAVACCRCRCEHAAVACCCQCWCGGTETSLTRFASPRGAPSRDVRARVVLATVQCQPRVATTKQQRARRPPCSPNTTAAQRQNSDAGHGSCGEEN